MADNEYKIENTGSDIGICNWAIDGAELQALPTLIFVERELCTHIIEDMAWISFQS